MPYGEAAELYSELEARARAVRDQGGASTGRWQRKPLRGSILVAAAVLVATVVALTAASLRSGSENEASSLAPPTRAQAPTLPVGSNPFGGPGEEVSLAEAKRVADFTIFTPSASLANSADLSDVWYTRAANNDGTRSQVA